AQTASWRLPLAQADVERALAAVVARRLLMTADESPKRRRRQPAGHGLTQHSRAARGRALAGNDEDMAAAVRIGTLQERQQQGMGFALRHAMQIDLAFDRQAAAGYLLVRWPVDDVGRWRLALLLRLLFNQIPCRTS